MKSRENPNLRRIFGAVDLLIECAIPYITSIYVNSINRSPNFDWKGPPIWAFIALDTLRVIAIGISLTTQSSELLVGELFLSAIEVGVRLANSVKVE